jgi:soluble lytic murein transglycosylase-like protein
MAKTLKCRLFVLAVALATQVTQAAERVTLHSGFVVSCDHHSQADGRARLFLSAGEDNYLELATNDITSIEKLPDLPAATDNVPTSPSGGALSAPSTKLSQADLDEMLASAGHDHNLDVDLLTSLVRAESGGNPRALSHAGAQGLMQLMPQTATELGVHDSYKPDQNVGGGSFYLDSLLIRYHDNLALALAAYNAGPAAVDKYKGIPPYHETRVYVARVIHEFNRRVLAHEVQSKTSSSKPAAMHN